MRDAISATGKPAAGRPAIPFSCIPHLLEYQARRIPHAPAILALGRAPLTYAVLYQHVRKTEQTLQTMGISRHDRVAVVLPNGPELAAAILAVAASVTCAPVNPVLLQLRWTGSGRMQSVGTKPTRELPLISGP